VILSRKNCHVPGLGLKLPLPDEGDTRLLAWLLQLATEEVVGVTLPLSTQPIRSPESDGQNPS